MPTSAINENASPQNQGLSVRRKGWRGEVSMKGLLREKPAPAGSAANGPPCADADQGAAHRRDEVEP
jgi:hypothetical protein